MTLTLDIIPIGPEEERENTIVVITSIQTQSINSHMEDFFPEVITDAEEATDYTISQTDPQIYHINNTCIQTMNNIIQISV
uniref:Uncharacterized protein n=2 Tax=Roseolovirus TaxID=40272 RepID=A0A1W6G8Z9_9BETA|nr:hypothetical protein [Human betaherpesvirus 6]AVI08403.1 hypothetical protein [Human betaherpesvirus 6B]ARJ99338.1 hypothetical protein [Human betaherpesvirus 6]ARJ99777.1 hypothetical protein [Human betaherpesvirus 6]ARK00117.1 hypothetical protein [Human betaherpesvirus 6]